MPTHLHESLLQLFRNRPEFAPDLLQKVLHQKLPAYSDARIDSAELNEVQPTEYRADLVVLLSHGGPVLGIVIEVQLSPDARKQYTWPVYVTGLRARLECPVCLLVITADDACARWAARRIELGGASYISPIVLGPSGVPEITDEIAAIADPELAVLSAVAHGEDTDVDKVVRIAKAAQQASDRLGKERSKLYGDLVFLHIGDGARQVLKHMNMNSFNYEYRSDFAKECLAEGQAIGHKLGLAQGLEEGRAEGMAKGRAELTVQLLTERFGPLSDEDRASVWASTRSRIDAIGKRLLTAASLEEALR